MFAKEKSFRKTLHKAVISITHQVLFGFEIEFCIIIYTSFTIISIHYEEIGCSSTNKIV